MSRRQSADWTVAVMNAVPAPVARLFRSNGRLAHLLRTFVNRVLPDQLRWASIRSGPACGIELLLDPQRDKFLWSGSHEPAVHRAMVDSLRPGATVWDIGAHVGYHAILASRLVGPEGRVVAIEPFAENRDRLAAAVARNQCSNVTILPVAVAGSAGPRVFHAGEGSATGALADRHDASGVNVDCVRLSDLEAEGGSPDFVKIDVEGSELEILLGSAPWIARIRPKMLVEFSNGEFVTRAQEVLADYRFEKLDASHWLLFP